MVKPPAGRRLIRLSDCDGQISFAKPKLARPDFRITLLKANVCNAEVIDVPSVGE